MLASLSSKQLASLIRAANTSYHDGRASNGGAEIIDGDAVWIGAGVEKLVPLAALRAMTVDERYEPREPGATVTCKSTRYQIDYTERC